MIPKLYDSFDLTAGAAGAVDFIGRIGLCGKCLVTENKRGEYVLDLETNRNDRVADLIISQRIIAAKPNPHDPIQYFVIQSTERDLSGAVRASAKHVKDFACQYTSEGDVTATDNPNIFNLTPSGIWDLLFDPQYQYISDVCPFTFYSDITATAGFYLGFNEPKTLGAILGGEDGSMLDMYSGEFKYDNYAISFLANRGRRSGYKLRYGRNITKETQKEDCLQTYSHILPCGSVSRADGKYINLFSDLYPIPNSESRSKRVFILDCSDSVRDIQLGTEGQHYSEARTRMTAYAEQYAAANSLGKINVSIEVTARADLDEMLQLGLCDTVKVELDEFGTNTTAKITSVTYDTLLERWDKMTVGASAVSLAELILNKRRYNL